MKTVSVLVASAIGLAGLAGYFWWQLDAERDRSQSQAQQREKLAAQPTQAELEQSTSTQRAAPTRLPVQSIVASSPVEPDQFDSLQTRRQEVRKQLLGNPSERELLRNNRA